MNSNRLDLNSDAILSLVEAAKRGDRQSLSQLVIVLSPIVHAHAKRIFISSDCERDDLIQEGMLGVLSAVKNYDPSRGASFSTYLNLCIRSKLLTAAKLSSNETQLIDGVGLADSIFCSESDIQQQDRDSYYELLDYINSKLTERELATLKLFLSGYSYVQIAGKLGTTEKSVDGNLQRVRKKLKDYNK